MFRKAACPESRARPVSAPATSSRRSLGAAGVTPTSVIATASNGTRAVQASPRRPIRSAPPAAITSRASNCSGGPSPPSASIPAAFTRASSSSQTGNARSTSTSSNSTLRMTIEPDGPPRLGGLAGALGVRIAGRPRAPRRARRGMRRTSRSRCRAARAASRRAPSARRRGPAETAWCGSPASPRSAPPRTPPFRRAPAIRTFSIAKLRRASQQQLPDRGPPEMAARDLELAAETGGRARHRPARHRPAHDERQQGHQQQQAAHHRRRDPADATSPLAGRLVHCTQRISSEPPPPVRRRRTWPFLWSWSRDHIDVKMTRVQADRRGAGLRSARARGRLLASLAFAGAVVGCASQQKKQAPVVRDLRIEGNQADLRAADQEEDPHRQDGLVALRHQAVLRSGQLGGRPAADRPPLRDARLLPGAHRARGGDPATEGGRPGGEGRRRASDEGGDVRGARPRGVAGGRSGGRPREDAAQGRRAVRGERLGVRQERNRPAAARPRLRQGDRRGRGAGRREDASGGGDDRGAPGGALPLRRRST